MHIHAFDIEPSWELKRNEAYLTLCSTVVTIYGPAACFYINKFCSFPIPCPHVLLMIFRFVSMALAAHSRPWFLIQFRNHISETIGLLGQVISSSQGRCLDVGQHKYRINAYTHQTYMHWVGFERTIPASEWAKTVHALDLSATVVGMIFRIDNHYFGIIEILDLVHLSVF
jgi:hypothetical protein